MSSTCITFSRITIGTIHSTCKWRKRGEREGGGLAEHWGGRAEWIKIHTEYE
jgi:hypothetical protein